MAPDPRRGWSHVGSRPIVAARHVQPGPGLPPHGWWRGWRRRPDLLRRARVPADAWFPRAQDLVRSARPRQAPDRATHRPELSPCRAAPCGGRRCSRPRGARPAIALGRLLPGGATVAAWRRGQARCAQPRHRRTNPTRRGVLRGEDRPSRSDGDPRLHRQRRGAAVGCDGAHSARSGRGSACRRRGRDAAGSVSGGPRHTDGPLSSPPAIDEGRRRGRAAGDPQAGTFSA